VYDDVAFIIFARPYARVPLKLVEFLGSAELLAW
jgi:hypothetical protein